MPHKHGQPRRAEIFFSDAAYKQLDKVTVTADARRIDRALAVLAADPELGEETPRPMMRSRWDEVEQVRIVYWLSAMRHRIVVGYLEW